MRMTRTFAPLLTAITTLMTAGGALAQEAAEHAATGEHHASPVPQFNPESFSGQLFWLAVSFVLLYWAMNSWVLPKVGRVVDARADRIASDLATAAHDRDAATASIAAYDASLATARAQAQSVIASAQAAAARMATEALSNQSRQLSDSARLTDTRIRAAVAAAEANLLPAAADTAAIVLKQLTGIAPAEKQIDDAVRTALNNHRAAQAATAERA